MDPWKPNQEDDDLALKLMAGWRQGIMSILNEDDEINYNSASTPLRSTGRYVAPIPPRKGDIDWSFPPNPSSSDQVAKGWSYAPPPIPESTNSTYLKAPYVGYIPSDVSSNSLDHQHCGLNFGYEINGWHYGANLISSPSHATLSPSLDFYVPSHPKPLRRLCSGLEIGSSSQSVGSSLNPISYNCLEDLTQRLSNHRISAPTQRSIPANIRSRCNVNVNVYEQLQNLVLETNYNTVAVGHAFDEVQGDIPRAMMDLQGSRLMESLVEMLSEEQRLTIVIKLTSNNRQFIRVCTNNYGNKAVAKLIKALQRDRYEVRQIFMKAFKSGDLLLLMKHVFGSKVIEACLQHLDDMANEAILQIAVSNCYGLATNRLGTSLLQSCMKNASRDARDFIAWKIIANGLELACDASGNYAVQFVVAHIPDDRMHAELKNQFRRNYAMLARDRFASNVVESCLTNWPDECERIVRELLNSPRLVRILDNEYANFVVQRAIDLTVQKDQCGRIIKTGIFRELCDAIAWNKDQLNGKFSRHILTKLRNMGVPVD